MPSYAAHRDYSPTKSSPLRHTLSKRSDTSDSAADPFVERTTSSSVNNKRDRSESPVKKSAAFARWEQREQAENTQHAPSTPTRTPSRANRTVPTMDISPKKIKDDDWRATLGRNESRAALRPVAINLLPDAVPDAPSASLVAKSPGRKENDDYQRYRPPSRDGPLESPSTTPPQSRARSEEAMKNNTFTLTRSDSMRASTRPRQNGHARFSSIDGAPPQLDGEDLAQLQKSSTPQFRHLSKMASEEGGEDFGIHSPEEQVVGMAGRRKLQRSGSVRPNATKQSSFASQYASTRWMDTQRKHLQAYEYLCHIGEARAWLQDVLDPSELPPIVQLEGALRDGVTLAEIVLRLAPLLPIDQQRALGSQRIFRSDRLQFRHSDNIALFFRFLAQVELPELFRFELVDLYEKKNIPKVIYCIHALSWLLFRKGVVDFRIGNLLGQLQFEEHELEETQKGIDRSGVQMPNFGGMREAMQVEEEPEPEPTPEELLERQIDIIVDFQSQARGTLVRLRLGAMMQDLWDVEESIAHFQAVARGGFSRELFDFKYNMDLSTREMQAAAKAFLVRRSLHRKQRAWRENTQAVVKVQSLWRGRKQRVETKQIRMQMQKHRHGLKQFQAAVRGALTRWRAGDLWHETREVGPEIAAFQAVARGALERLRISMIMQSLWDVEDRIAGLQAAIRGARARKKAASQKVAARKAAVDVVRLQAAARGLIQRMERKEQHGHVQVHHNSVTDVQSAARGLLARLQQARTIGALQGRESNIIQLQGIIRAYAARKAVQIQQGHLSSHVGTITQFQTLARGLQCRNRHGELREELSRHSQDVTALQAFARAMLQRRDVGVQLAALEDEEESIAALQSFARAYVERQRIYEDLVAMEKEQDGIVQLQALARAMILRAHVGRMLAEIEDHEPAVEELQAACRAFVVRAHFAEKRSHYRENMQKVIKLQSFVRAKQQGESYRSLVNGKNPPLPVVRRHLHLLTDSTLEFEEELEAERLRRQVGESVRRNEHVEGYVEGLDVKIALLVKNKITLDEVVRHQKHFGGSASQLLRNGATVGRSAGGLDLKALNKSSRKQLAGYEELFFLLQTQPVYLARLFQRLSSKGLAEKEGKDLERLTLTLFGYAQKRREEYLLLKVLTTSTEQVVNLSQNLDDFLRRQNGSFHQRLLLSYARSPKDRSYLKSLLGGLVRDGICGQEHLDLESDPLQIYRAILNNAELSTGQPSSRPRDLPREVVIREPDVRPRYIEHLQDLRDLCDRFFLSLEETLHRMPYGVRYVAAEQHRALCEHFPREDPNQMAMLAGNWIWKSYLLLALKEPEMWGVVDRGLSPLHRRNLAQIITVLGQVVAGRLFSAENLYLQPLNTWVSESLERWQECLNRLFDLPTPEQYFDADQFSDLYATTKPTVYVKLADVFALHGLVADNVAAIALARDDPIKEILVDLGTAKGNESDLSGAAQGGEITLTLKPRFAMQEDPNAEARALFTATKRLVLYIIKVQSGANLMEILLRPIDHEDADRWTQLVREELAAKDRSENRPPRRHNAPFDPRASLRGARTQSVYSEAPSAVSEDRRDLLDLQNTTYAELKSSALENILALENPAIPPQFRVSRQNNYQEILNALAADIRQKHRRRLERQREKEVTRANLAQLDAKAAFLDEQLRSYNDYIEQCLHTLAAKKSGPGARHRFLLPFTKQWAHERELDRSGRQPRFGSYKYSARALADKGVLVSWPPHPQDLWRHIDIALSSDHIGVFHLEASSGSTMLPGASAVLLLDDLLQAQYDNRHVIEIFAEGGGGSGAKAGNGGGAKLSVNLLLHLVFKKFYRDE